MKTVVPGRPFAAAHFVNSQTDDLGCSSRHECHFGGLRVAPSRLSANEGTFTPPPALRAFPAVAAVLMPFVALLFRPDFIRLAEGRSSAWAVSSDGWSLVFLFRRALF
jgi:hypothetical protein